jgi:sugar lactone lactonase YvrE
MSALNPELVFDSDDCVGESPRWDARRGCVWWIDNERATVHRHFPAVGETQTFQLPVNASSLALADDDEVLATLPDGVYRLGDGGSGLERLIPMDTRAEACSFNDSGCDARGRLWIGSGSETVTGQGGLWVVRADSSCAELVLDGLSLPNGIGFSPDNRFMYLVDSIAGAIYRIAYDLGTGTLGEREEFCVAPGSDGLPDGLAVDVEGGVWVAFWDGGCVRRYAPDGTLDTVIEFPVRRVAGCAFGGPLLSDLYVTSAWYDLSARERADQPLAGALFRVATTTSGVPIGRIAAVGT